MEINLTEKVRKDFEATPTSSNYPGLVFKATIDGGLASISISSDTLRGVQIALPTELLPLFVTFVTGIIPDPEPAP